MVGGRFSDCPSSPQDAIDAFHKAGIELNPAIFGAIEAGLGFFMKKHEGEPEFQEGFFHQV